MELEKTYYSITETAEIFNVNASLLRYWEKEFPQIKPYKNKKGDRYFTRKDIETIRTIFHLTKERGFTLQGAREELKRGTPVASGTDAVVLSLERIREKLLGLQGRLDVEA